MSDTVTAALALIAAERERQVLVEHYSAEHDDAYTAGELPRAAATYARHASRLAQLGEHADTAPPALWPWPAQHWKPSPDPLVNLKRAGALILAEIERVLRQNDREAAAAREAEEAQRTEIAATEAAATPEQKP